MRVPAVIADEEPSQEPSDMLVGRCESIQEVYKLIGRVASQDVTVLILGESGTGKELAARAIPMDQLAPWMALEESEKGEA